MARVLAQMPPAHPGCAGVGKGSCRSGLWVVFEKIEGGLGRKAGQGGGCFGWKWVGLGASPIRQMKRNSESLATKIFFYFMLQLVIWRNEVQYVGTCRRMKY